MSADDEGLRYWKVGDEDYAVELPSKVVRVRKDAPVKGPDGEVIGRVTSARVVGDALAIDMVVRGPAVPHLIEIAVGCFSEGASP